MKYNRISFYCVVTSVVAVTIGSTALAADSRYPEHAVQKIEVFDPSSSSAWENKNWLDCNDVVLTEEDVRYALRHMRRISENSYFNEDTDRTGCSGGASITFNSGRMIVIEVEPTGYIHTFETTKKMKPIKGSTRFYDCEPCSERKMGLLQDALDRATERRIKELKKQGRIPP